MRDYNELAVAHRHTYNANYREMECCICLAPQLLEDAQPMPCSHALHAVCLLKFIYAEERRQQYNAACPICRQPLDSMQLECDMLFDTARPLKTQLGLWTAAHEHQRILLSNALPYEGHFAAAGRVCDSARKKVQECSEYLVRLRRLRRLERELGTK